MTSKGEYCVKIERGLGPAATTLPPPPPTGGRGGGGLPADPGRNRGCATSPVLLMATPYA